MKWRALALATSCFAVAAGAQVTSAPPAGIDAADSAGFAKGRYAQLDALPDWGGIWFVSFERGPGIPAPPQPSLKGEYLAALEAWREEVRVNNGVERRPRGNCSPPGLPRIMQLPQYPYEFLFTPGRVTINQEAWMQTRTIWTDGRSHPPLEEIDPSYHGHSIGHWEGETLVVDTVGISADLEIDDGARHSDQFRLIERIHIAPDDPDMLVNHMRMEDPLAFAEPFEVTVRYRRDRHGALIEFQCSQNDRNPVDSEGYSLFE